MSENADRIMADLDSIKRKLNSMPTTRECWAYVLGFATCGAFVIALAVFAPVVV